jgi:hypothetical protein
MSDDEQEYQDAFDGDEMDEQENVEPEADAEGQDNSNGPSPARREW